jgi:catechol 2,3-dioxygenase-like lactoylglutathione lyase family enzyme
MQLVSIRIITEDAKKLGSFYAHITGIPPVFYTEDFAELKTPSVTLAIGSTKTLKLFGGDEFAKAAQNRTAIIEFLVNDVDDEYNRLSGFLKDLIVQKPTTMSWGNRSFLFRDTDGNLINFFTPVTREAIQKFNGASTEEVA